nr:hypothetical protein [Tanacetum cinerariifolium]
MLKKEKEGLDRKLTGFQSASKDLDNLLGSQRPDKNKEGLGYSVIPPPAQVYSPSKKDMSWIGLPEFADDTITNYSRPSPSPNSNIISVIFKKYQYIDTQGRLNGCSRHMTGNISYLSDYEPYDGGYVSFGQGGCKITSKRTIKTDESMLWHRRLGHLNFKTMNRLVRHNLVKGLPSTCFDNDHTCVACLKGKQHKASCKTKLVNSVSKPLHNLHMDLFGPTSTFFLKTKNETSSILRNFITEIENLKELKVKIIRTPQQNGVAERRNRTLIEAARTMLADAKLPVTFWAEAVNTACYVQNRGLHNMYSIDLNNIVPHKDLTCLVAKASADECMLWHRRLGHLNFKTMNKLVRHNLVRGLPTKRFENDHTCTACLKGKQHKASLTDDFSRFTWTFFLKSKDETSGILKKFITEIENLKDLKVKIIRTPQQNGVVERRNRTLIKAARTMLANAKLPVTFWAEAVNTACYVQNRVLVNKSHNKTPYELFNGRSPTIGFLKPFSCHVMILNALDNLGKFEEKGDE